MFQNVSEFHQQFFVNSALKSSNVHFGIADFATATVDFVTVDFATVSGFLKI